MHECFDCHTFKYSGQGFHNRVIQIPSGKHIVKYLAETIWSKVRFTG